MINLGQFITDPIGALKNFASGMFDAAKNGYEAAEAMDEFTVSVAKQNAAIRDNEIQINALTKAIKDKTKSEQERIKIAETIADLEIKNSEMQKKLAEEALANERKLLEGKTLSGEEQAKLIELESEVRARESEKQIAIADRQTKINILLAKEEAGQLKDIRAEEKAQRDQEKKVEAEKKKAEKDAALLQAKKDAEDFAKAESSASNELDKFRAQRKIKLETDLQERMKLEIDYQNLITQQKLVGIKEGSEQEKLIVAENEAAIYDIKAKFAEATTAKSKEEGEKQKKDDQAVANAKKQSIGALFGAFSQATQAGLVSAKAFTVAQLGLNTAEAIGQLTAKSEGNPANTVTFGGAGIIQFATGLIRILANIASAKKLIGFAGGGKVLSSQYIGNGDGIPISRSNGDNLLATVKTGEVILNEEQQAALGGSQVFTKLGLKGFANGGFTGSIPVANSSEKYFEELINAVRTTKTVLVYEDFQAKQNEINGINSTAQIV
jgi:hypothetical protein